MRKLQTSYSELQHRGTSRKITATRESTQFARTEEASTNVAHEVSHRSRQNRTTHAEGQKGRRTCRQMLGAAARIFLSLSQGSSFRKR